MGTSPSKFKGNDLPVEQISREDAQKFIEKPDFKKAQKYFKSDKYFWNSGIFIFNVDFIIEQFKLWQVKLFDQAYNAFHMAIKNNNITTLLLESYLPIEAISLDYAIIENIKQMIMIEASFSWSDLGSWYSLWQLQKKDITANYCEGDIIKIDTTNSYICSNNKLTALIGIDNLVVINTDDALLIVNKSKIDEIKHLMIQMTESGRKEI
jgi:mannose-1-phosphate guanylyltransferase